MTDSSAPTFFRVLPGEYRFDAPNGWTYTCYEHGYGCDFPGCGHDHLGWQADVSYGYNHRVQVGFYPTLREAKAKALEHFATTSNLVRGDAR